MRGIEPWRIFAQYMGRADGPTRGRDGNVHMADPRLGLIAMVSHLPAMLPVAVGMALAFRIREERRVALGWFGEGAAARGDAHEAMNLAGVRQLPVVFVFDNNQWAYSTPTPPRVRARAPRRPRRRLRLRGRRRRRHRRARRLPRGERAIEKAREGGGPTLIECLTLRMEGHAVHDDAFYVPQELFEEWARARPDRALPHLAARARRADGRRGGRDHRGGQEAPERRARARRGSPRCPIRRPSLDGVFATPEELDTPHHK